MHIVDGPENSEVIPFGDLYDEVRSLSVLTEDHALIKAALEFMEQVNLYPVDEFIADLTKRFVMEDVIRDVKHLQRQVAIDRPENQN